jgi:hypothetical protein
MSAHDVRLHTLIMLSGRVTTTPQPPGGKLVYLQAQTVTAVWNGHGPRRRHVLIHGPWTTFRALRASSTGHFKAAYRSAWADCTTTDSARSPDEKATIRCDWRLSRRRGTRGLGAEGALVAAHASWTFET